MILLATDFGDVILQSLMEGEPMAWLIVGGLVVSVVGTAVIKSTEGRVL